ncbi:hypothetical protein FQ187_07950 [Pseudomonas sp. ANT_J28]|nr:hypothetical protein FQ187_07950 [Pseudomonas sp. ANT_J28]
MIAFASKPAPTVDRVLSGEMRSNVGAGLLAKRPSAAQQQSSRQKKARITAGLLCFSGAEQGT